MSERKFGIYIPSYKRAATISTHKIGNEIGMGHLSSWTTSDHTIEQILANRAGLGEECTQAAEVILKCKSKTGVDIANISTISQQEVLFSAKSRFVVRDVKKKLSNGAYAVTSVVVELEEVV